MIVCDRCRGSLSVKRIEIQATIADRSPAGFDPFCVDICCECFHDLKREYCAFQVAAQREKGKQ